MTLAFITTSGTWTVPANVFWLTYVDCIGAGGNGTASNRGGGGGAFARVVNRAVTPGTIFDVVVGMGLNTIFGGTSIGVCVCGAKAAFFYSGGKASDSVGDIRYNGGNGNLTFGGGGGAGGPGGAGQTSSGYIGGAGGGGLGGGAAPANANGLSGTEYDATHGSGGGAGGRNTTGPGRVGGNYGGGGGGFIDGTAGGQGSPGLIVISYTASTYITLTADQGSYAQAAPATGLISNSILPSTSGAYTLSGGSAEFSGLGFQCDRGMYSLSGGPAFLTSPAKLPAPPGVYAFFGGAATIFPTNPAAVTFYVAKSSRIFNVVEGS